MIIVIVVKLIGIIVVVVVVVTIKIIVDNSNNSNNNNKNIVVIVIMAILIIVIVVVVVTVILKISKIIQIIIVVECWHSVRLKEDERSALQLGRGDGLVATGWRQDDFNPPGYVLAWTLSSSLHMDFTRWRVLNHSLLLDLARAHGQKISALMRRVSVFF